MVREGEKVREEGMGVISNDGGEGGRGESDSDIR